MHVFGSSGVRGVAGETMTPGFVLQIAQATGSVWADDYDRVAVGRDTRTTGRTLANAAVSGLTSLGLDVDRVGVVPTPGLQAYCSRNEVPGLMVTASHNPPAYNGVKVVGADGVGLTRDALNRIETALDDAVAHVGWAETGTDRTVESARRTYREAVVAAVDAERIAAADLTVVVDPGHGAGSLVSPDLFRELGCTVHTVHAQPDGHFPGRNPEPVPENLADLRAYVESTGADLGIAHDGDADRAMFVDETGTHVPGESSLAALAAAELEPGDTVVSAVNASQRLVDAAEAADADLSLSPIGSTNIVSRIRALEEAGETVPVAGEGNGGLFFPRYRIARDGAYTAARFCELVAVTPASELVEPYSDYHTVRRGLEYDDEAEREAMLDRVEAYATDADADIDTTDGWRLDYGDAWVLARPSGTEPIVRVYAEARDVDRAASLADELVDVARS
ncbi:phosphoglucosamine mutase [Halomicroarcula sp. GCM10025324]|uniref:phosphoglucosamine mutase n=1 Tax=Haloarcula TaxID=2237 RepID=UPI0023E82325|nr:phosphoglucosamine mutase [Halomicroarcula sp. ZS-22-S1]